VVPKSIPITLPMAGSLTFKQTAASRSDTAHGWLHIDI